MKLLSICLCFILSLLSLDIQSQWDKNYEEVIKSRYEGGLKEFEALMYSHLRYPRISLQNCEMGEGLVEMLIGKSGEIKELKLVNNLTSELEDEILSSLEITKGKWKKGEKEIELKMSIGFRIGNDQVMGGDLKVTAIRLVNSANGCRSNQEIEKKLKRAIKKGNKKKAEKMVEELLRRSPLNSDYHEMNNKLKRDN